MLLLPVWEDRDVPRDIYSVKVWGGGRVEIPDRFGAGQVVGDMHVLSQPTDSYEITC